jgi:hypothetical protein
VTDTALGMTVSADLIRQDGQTSVRSRRISAAPAHFLSGMFIASPQLWHCSHDFSVTAVTKTATRTGCM